jgi:Tfp pilus assembly protein PilX
VSRREPRIHSSQGGAALISVIFLIVVVALLGTFAIRTGSDQQQMANLTVLEAKADAAAFSGLEYASNRLKNSAFACPTVPASGVAAPFPAIPQSQPVTVKLQCSPLNAVSGTVYLITATASYGALGNVDFVQRVRARRVSTLGAGSW